MNIDYQALTDEVTKTDIANFKKAYPKSGGFSLFTALAVSGLLSLFFVVPMAVNQVSEPGVASFAVPIYTAAIFFLVGIVAWIGSGLGLKKKVRLAKFAQANGFTYLTNMKGYSHNGMIFSVGHSRKFNDAINGINGAEIGNYQYVTGSGKNAQTHTYGYIRLPLERRLPHMVLDAKSNNFWKLSNGLPQSFNKDQVLALEGDFNNHFTLYAPKEYEPDALYVFTPDVMHAMIEHGQKYDMEIVDDNIFIYSQAHFKMTEQEELKTLINLIGVFQDQLGKQSRRYRDDRVANVQLNIVAEEGRRLKSSVNIFVVLIVIIICAFMVFSATW